MGLKLVEHVGSLAPAPGGDFFGGQAGAWLLPGMDGQGGGPEMVGVAGCVTALGVKA